MNLENQTNNYKTCYYPKQCCTYKLQYESTHESKTSKQNLYQQNY